MEDILNIKNKKILIMCPLDIGGERGDYVRMFRVSRYIRCLAKEVRFIATDSVYGPLYKIERGSNKYFNFIYTSLQMFLVYPVVYLSFKPDVIFVRSLQSQIVASFYKLFNKKTLIVDSALGTDPKKYLVNKIGMFKIFLTKKLTKYGDLFTAENEVFKEGQETNGVNKDISRVLYPYISIDYTKTPNNSKCVYIAYFNKDELFEEVLERIGYIKNICPAFELDIYGYGPMENKYKKIVRMNKSEDYIKFKGKIDRKEVLEKIKDYNVCLLGKHSGQKGYDYLSKCRPIVALDTEINRCVMGNIISNNKNVKEYMNSISKIITSESNTENAEEETIRIGKKYSLLRVLNRQENDLF